MQPSTRSTEQTQKPMYGQRLYGVLRIIDLRIKFNILLMNITTKIEPNNIGIVKNRVTSVQKLATRRSDRKVCEVISMASLMGA